MLHLVETLDGHTARRCYQVDGSFGMQTAGFEQFYGTLHCLHDDGLGVVGLEAQLHTAFGCRTDIAHGIGDTAGGQGCAGCEVLLVGDQGSTHFVEDRLHLLCMLLCHCTTRYDEGHRGHLSNGDVRNDKEQGRAVVTQTLLDACRGDACCNYDQDLFLGIQFGLDVFQHTLYKPGLDNNTDDVGGICRQLIICRHADTCLCKLLHHGLRGVADGDVLVLELLAFDEALNGGATHSACTNHCYLHFNFFFF